jgi:thiol-disulfide isomerase/thioredoxin
MTLMTLDNPRVRAPEFPASVWLNTYSEVSLQTLLPGVVLIDFWDYTCINCLRTLPYLRAWHERYQDLGFEIVGVHTPEFSFAGRAVFVKAAIGRLGLRWPVILDNDQKIWTSYTNRYWPTVYLVDPQGYIRFSHAGEGGYTQIETAIQALLLETQPELQLPSPLPMFRAEDKPDAVCAPTTQELHVDALSGALPADNKPTQFILPIDFQEGHFYLEGLWSLYNDGLTLESEHGNIVLPYSAADVYAVLSPNPLGYAHMHYEHSPLKIEILQDGQPLPDDRYGQDIFKTNGQSMLRVDIPRNYHLVNNPAVDRYQLQLRLLEHGLTFFAFSFGSCAAINAANSDGSQES